MSPSFVYSGDHLVDLLHTHIHILDHLSACPRQTLLPWLVVCVQYLDTQASATPSPMPCWLPNSLLMPA